MPYRTIPDPYCYPGTSILKNKLNLRSAPELDAFEAEITMERAREPLPRGRLSVSHYKAIHHHLFQDVYSWAGRFRSVRIHKNSSTFCFPENIASEMRKLFSRLRKQSFLQNQPKQQFAAEAAHFVAELNAIHPFREGNGRTQLTFLFILAETAGHPLDFDKMQPRQMLDAMIASFKGNENPLEKLIAELA